MADGEECGERWIRREVRDRREVFPQTRHPPPIPLRSTAGDDPQIVDGPLARVSLAGSLEQAAGVPAPGIGFQVRLDPEVDGQRHVGRGEGCVEGVLRRVEVDGTEGGRRVGDVRRRGRGVDGFAAAAAIVAAAAVDGRFTTSGRIHTLPSHRESSRSIDARGAQCLARVHRETELGRRCGGRWRGRGRDGMGGAGVCSSRVDAREGTCPGGHGGWWLLAGKSKPRGLGRLPR